MSGQSPPRSRRTQPQPGQVHNVQQRETSRSPSIVERTTRQAKAQSMPLGPSTTSTQLYSHNNGTQQSLLSLGQSSPPIANGPRRSPPPGQAHRMLPTPPHQNSQIDPTQDRRSTSPAPLHQHIPSGVQPHNPRPMYNNTARVLDKYQGEQWDYSDQLIQLDRADIQPVSVQQQHGIPQASAQLPHLNSYPPASSYSREETVSPPKDPVERVRVTERASPKDLDLNRRREQQAARESPKNRDRQQVSTLPSSATFSLQNHSHTPENRSSPYHASHASQGDYTPYLTHDQPSIGRRNTISMAHPSEGRSQQGQQMASQTPPATMSTRAPDRSLPVQEEAEDDVGLGSKSGASARDSWKSSDAHLDQQRSESPAQDEDLTSEETGGPRYDTNAHASINGRDEKSTRMGSKDDLDDHRYGDRDHTAEEYTPRSPASTLPENLMDSFPSPSPTTAKMNTIRAKARAGPTDQLGLRGLDAIVEQNGPPVAIRDPNPPPPQPQPPSANDQARQQQYAHRRPVPDIGNDQMQQQQQQQQHGQSPQQPSQQQLQQSQQNQQIRQQSPQQSYRGYDPRDLRYSSRGYYMPDELHNYPDDASVYFQSYIQSPRPDAPIPPTPHSQSAAPSPSPLITGALDRSGGRDMYSPIIPAGSPFPYPYGHLRRQTHFGPSANNSYNGNNNANANGQGGGPQNIDQAMLREQYAKQWQIFAQNNNWGAMSDSTFSPAPTPFQGAFSPWAHWHTQKIFGRMPPDTMSMQSSPSHEPVPLPRAPLNTGARKGPTTKAREGSKLRREASSSVSPPRKPPPRVESTQPRDTSPEPTSGEETAGEDSYPTPQSNYITPGSVGYDERWVGVVPIGGEEEDEADWVDEDEELDPEDLLDLEYHPSYVRTADKRRRRWEIGWEALTQAFQNLDRQTDTTMVLVASPPDSSKLHIISSRSVRRTPVLNRSPAMAQLRASFRGMAQHRRQTRTRKQPIIDHLLAISSSGEGSDGSSESREVDLRRALDAALNSLDVLKSMYDQKVARWNDEMTKMHQEREGVEFFLKQLYGDRHPVNGMNGEVLSATP